MATPHAAARPVNPLKRPISRGAKCWSANKLWIFRTSARTRIFSPPLLWCPRSANVRISGLCRTSERRSRRCASAWNVPRLLIAPRRRVGGYIISKFAFPVHYTWSANFQNHQPGRCFKKKKKKSPAFSVSGIPLVSVRWLYTPEPFKVGLHIHYQ